MISLLKQIDITAYSVLIRSGNYRYPFIEEFPHLMFNHLIVCVPMQKDTMWLECTNSSSVCGVIGASNENRQALMIKPEGGVIVKTPTSSEIQNQQIRNSIVTLKVTGVTEVITDVKWFGNQANYVAGVLEHESKDEIEKWITKKISVPNLIIQDYKFVKNDSYNFDIRLRLHLSLPRYATVSSNRIFFQPNLMEKLSSVPAEVEKRYSPIKLSYPYRDVDSARYTLPEGYIIETLPSGVELKTSFGNFHMKTVLEKENIILFTRFIEVYNYSIPAEDYSGYRKFMQDVVTADRAMIVLIKK